MLNINLNNPKSIITLLLRLLYLEKNVEEIVKVLICNICNKMAIKTKEHNSTENEFNKLNTDFCIYCKILVDKGSCLDCSKRDTRNVKTQSENY